MADFTSKATAFVNSYHTAFDADRSKLASFYRETSTLTVDGVPYKGLAAIVDKIKSLPLDNPSHSVSTLSAQQSTEKAGDLIVLVSGEMTPGGGRASFPFVQTFSLTPEGDSYYVESLVVQRLSS